MVLLGIDQGTTGTRACLVDRSLTIVASAYAAHAQHTPAAGLVEHDAAEIWTCTQRVIAEVLAGRARPAGIALANQGETVVAWDARDGRPLHRALVWQDTRGEALMARHAAHGPTAALIRDRTGLHPDAYFSASKLRWLLQQEGVRELAAAGHLRAGTLDTWLIERLTGGAVFATDASTAARTLLCETRRCTWSAELLDLFEIPRGILPEIRDSDAGFGTCTVAGLEGVPILASLVDQPAALIGQGCVDRGDVKATFGTGCFVYANAGTTRPDAPGATLATVAWRRGGDHLRHLRVASGAAARSGRAGPCDHLRVASGAAARSGRAGPCETTYALDGGVLAVGSAIQWAGELGLPTDEDALAAPVPDGLACVPALVGLGAPHWDRVARGAWLGMTSGTTPVQLVGALAEGLACRVVEVVRAIEREAGVTVRMLRADGGLTRSFALMQRVADLLGTPVALAAEDEATTVGACAVAALRVGAVTLDDLRRRRDAARVVIAPTITAEERAGRLVRFASALAVARQWR